jgi:hypothetical protein
MRKSRCMDPKVDWLNGRIDRMQAGRSLFPIDPPELDRPGEYIAMLRMAAQLNGVALLRRPGALDPDPQFLARLRDKVLSACEEAAAPPRPKTLRP